MIDIAVAVTFPQAMTLSTTADWIVSLLFGWITFLFRVIPTVTVDRGSMIFATVALVLFTVGSHFAARKCYRWFVTDRPDLPHKWPLRCTMTAVAGLFVLFTAGISLIGVTHQVAWLATGDEPLTGTGNGSRWVHDTRITIKQIGQGLHNYHDTYSVFPAGGSFDADGTARHSWVTATLVFLNYEHDAIDFDYPWRHPKNEPQFRSVLPELINAGFRTTEYRDTEGFGLSHFAANSHVIGPNRWAKLGEITDGTTDTILIGEVNTGFRPWGDPVNWRDPADGFRATPTTFGGPPGHVGVTFLMADGSVREVSNETDASILRALATPSADDVMSGSDE